MTTNECEARDANSKLSSYSRTLLHLEDPIESNKSYNIFLANYLTLLNTRASCAEKLKKYTIALRDLNCIIQIIQSAANKYHSTYAWEQTAIPEYTKALLQRARIFLLLGNTGQSFSDYFEFFSRTCNVNTDPDSLNYYYRLYRTNTFQPRTIPGKRLRELGLQRHPSKQGLISYNKYTRRLNKFSIGWQQLKTKSNVKHLPLKQGHSMVVSNGKIYCFGGSSLLYKTVDINELRKLQDSCEYIFFEILITPKTSNYTWKLLPFPFQYKRKLNPQNKLGWSRVITIHKWRHNIILFGGFNPFRNVLIFNLNSRKWNEFKIKKKINFKTSQFMTIDNHSAVIMNDKLYVFGGHDNDSLFCLDLINKNWKRLAGSKNIYKNIGNEIPKHRIDNIMWSDRKKGKLGSVYIAFGNFHPKDDEIWSRSRKDFWRFDIATKKWNIQKFYGNFPVYRAESGYTSTEQNDGVIIFGGYNPLFVSDYNGTLGRYVYFADCFEFSSKSEKWKMIQSQMYPSHRAFPALCRIDNLIVLYGGYHGGEKDDQEIFNDLWILDMNKCNTKKNEKLKYCQDIDCSKTSNEMKLYVCKGCRNTEYCSIKCQKRHWNTLHRTCCNSH